MGPSSNSIFFQQHKIEMFGMMIERDWGDIRTQNQDPPCVTYDDADGHYIIHAMDVLNGRYKIIDLLGYGTFGRVVRCIDIFNNSIVAVKIVKSLFKYREASKAEIRVLLNLTKIDPYSQMDFLHLLDWFDFRGHICMVFDVLGQSIYDFLKVNLFQPFTLQQIQSITYQTFRAVAFLHDNGIVHTDLKLENILLVNDGADLFPNEENGIYRSLRSSKIKLIDFGSAVYESEYHPELISTRHYRAPEVVLGIGWSYPCDVFSIGCMLAELFTGNVLFNVSSDENHINEMQQILGSFPTSLTSRIRRNNHETKNLFDQFGRYRLAKNGTRNSLKNIISPTDYYTRQFLDLTARCLILDPHRRITATEALNHPFFHEWMPNIVYHVK